MFNKNRDENEFMNAGAAVQQQAIPAMKDFSMIYQITDTTEYLKKIEHLIRRERKTKDGKGWEVVPGVRPYMNEEGIYTVMSIISSTIDRTVGQGNFDSAERKYNIVLAMVWRNVNDTLFLNQQAFDIEEKHLMTLVPLIMTPVRVYLTRLLSDNERRYIFGQKMDVISQFVRNLAPKGKQNISGFN